MTEESRIRRYAVQYNPPTLVIEYQTNKGLFLKKIKMKHMKQDVVYHFEINNGDQSNYFPIIC